MAGSRRCCASPRWQHARGHRADGPGHLSRCCRLGPARPRRGCARATGVLPGRPFVRQTWQLDGERDRLRRRSRERRRRCSRAAPTPPARLQAPRRPGQCAGRRQGRRVIAVAFGALPGEAAALPEPDGLRRACSAFEDPLRDDVRRGARGVPQAGVRVMMMTGDAAATALAIARQAGLDATAGTVLTGAAARCDERGRARARHPPRRRLRPCLAGAEAAHRPGAAASRRCRGDDRRRRQRRPGAARRRRRRGDGRARHRRRARGRRHRPSRRPLLLAGRGACAPAAASSPTCRGRWATCSRCTCRSSGCRCSRCSAGRSCCCRSMSCCSS